MSTLHINRPSSTRFRARVRLRGHRKYLLIGKPTRSAEIAILRMARKFASSSMYKRGDVVVIADYYDPSPICELVRR